MGNDFWLNLPSKDLTRARAFFTALGFTINDAHGQPNMLSLVVGDNKVIVNFFPEAMFQGMSGAPVADMSKSAETLISVGVGSRGEVDSITSRVEPAGGKVFGKPSEIQGWMYGCGFTDLDGHRWNLLHMDMSKMQK